MKRNEQEPDFIIVTNDYNDIEVEIFEKENTFIFQQVSSRIEISKTQAWALISIIENLL